MDGGGLTGDRTGKALDGRSRVIDKTLGGSNGADHAWLGWKRDDAILDTVEIDAELFWLFFVFVLRLLVLVLILILVLLFRFFFLLVLGPGLLLRGLLSRRRHRSRSGLFFLGFLHFGFIAQRGKR